MYICTYVPNSIMLFIHIYTTVVFFVTILTLIKLCVSCTEPPQKTVVTDNIEHSVHEDSSLSLTLTLQNDLGDVFFRVYKNGRLLDIDGIRYRYTIVDNVHTLMLTSAQRDDTAVFQMEVWNLAGRIVQYNYVTVLCE